MISHQEIRRKYLDFYKNRGHTIIKPAPLVLQGDATTLFTSSGMQPLVPVLSGREMHPAGKRLVDIQPSVRTQDIEEVGDNRHTTFFEMLGNWSLGDYFKQEQLAWIWEFLTKELGLPKERLYVTVYAGGADVPRDDESADIWRKIGVPDNHIYFYKGNWWSRAGTPDKMPTGEIGGPDSEIFYDFGEGPHDGPESDESRFLEIANSVFIQYEKQADGSLQELPQKNVDFGGGFERIIAAVENQPDILKTTLFDPITTSAESIFDVSYDDYAPHIRIIADHIRAAVFLIKDGVTPSNKEHGYVLRRLLRKAAIKVYQIDRTAERLHELTRVVPAILKTYEGIYFENADERLYNTIIIDEINRFKQSLEKGFKMLQKKEQITGQDAFDLFQTYGFPVEMTLELLKEDGKEFDMKQYQEAKDAHQAKSKSASVGMFKGGLADNSQKVTQYHTATHLIHQALHDLLGESIRQEGSNITGERLRFDFASDMRPSDDIAVKLEEAVNQKITENLPVYSQVLPRQKADKIGARSFFKDKYGDEVKVYFIGGDGSNPEGSYSKEFCGGPHVTSTGEIEPIKITKLKKIGGNIYRIYAE